MWAWSSWLMISISCISNYGPCLGDDGDGTGDEEGHLVHEEHLVALPAELPLVNDLDGGEPPGLLQGLRQVHLPGHRHHHHHISQEDFQHLGEGAVPQEGAQLVDLGDVPPGHHPHRGHHLLLVVQVTTPHLLTSGQSEE